MIPASAACVSYSDALAKTFGTQTRLIMQQPWYQRTFPECQGAGRPVDRRAPARHRLRRRHAMDPPQRSPARPSMSILKSGQNVCQGRDDPGRRYCAAGNIYVSDIDKSSILKVTPSGSISTLIQDERLDWPDAMWIDQQGFLWVPASQMDRTPPFNRPCRRCASSNYLQAANWREPSPIDHP